MGNPRGNRNSRTCYFDCPCVVVIWWRRFPLILAKGESIKGSQKTSTYRPGKRSPDWLKIKSRPQQEFIVCGFSEGKGSRKPFGALRHPVLLPRGCSRKLDQILTLAGLAAAIFFTSHLQAEPLGPQSAPLCCATRLFPQTEGGSLSALKAIFL
jgi:hypothetical protein